MTESIKPAMDWAVANWTTIAAVLLALLAVVNKFTARWDEGERHWATRALLILTELLSVLTSRGWRTALGSLKLPLTLKSGKRGSIFPPTPPASIILLVGGLGIMGCSNSLSATHKSLFAAHQGAQISWAAAIAILDPQAEELAHTCHQEGDTICEGLREIQERRRNVATAIAAVHAAVATALLAIEAAKKDPDDKALAERASALVARAIATAQRVKQLLDKRGLES